MPIRLLESFLPRNQPWITRGNYAREAVHSLTFPFALSLMEGAVVGVLARKAFGVSYWQFATLMAAPMFANLTSFLWARLARGRRKVRFLTVVQLCMLATVGLLALLPTAGPGPSLLIGLIVISRCLVAGLVTIRSTIWRMNYPRHTRAQVTGRLTLINSVLIAGVPLVGYACLDHNPQAFRLLYPAGVVIALVGVWSFSHVRLRREAELLRYETKPGVRPQPRGIPGPVYEYDPKEQSPGFWAVLRKDRLFRHYMGWQFLNGGSNMSAEVLLICIVADLTEKVAAGHQYLLSIAITSAIPWVLATIALPVWARYLDRVHVVHFRLVHGWFWVASQCVYLLGALFMSLPLLAAARVIAGLGRGGAMLAWQLGHNDFASRRLVAQYMGIHITLTGVRGAIVPFLAIAIYAGWPQFHIPFLHLTLPGFDGAGPYVFVYTIAVALIAQAGFFTLSRSLPRQI